MVTRIDSTRLRVFGVLVLLASACGAPASSGNGSDAFVWALDIGGGNVGDTLKGDDKGLHDGTPDAGTDLDATDGETSTGETLIGDGDAASGETTVGCDFPATPAKGEPGASCVANADCDSGICVDGPGGKICTVTCTECCPSGFKCATYTGGVDPVLACLPAWTELCRPCQADAECADDKGALCVTYGGTGSFCGAKCDTNADCPQGFGCQASQGSVGAGNQCVKLDGVCGCSPAATAAGAKTMCSVSNANGSCTGTRKCTLSGLTPCPATTPGPEVCDGADNNCNGQTDEPGASGCVTYYPDGDGDGSGKIGSVGQCVCTAVGNATATTATDCDDTNPAIHPGVPELCDNIDNNCNGVTDEGCDDDGDGWCDSGMVVVGKPVACAKGEGDCDDTNAAIHPNQPEVCGNGIDDNCDGLTDTGADPSGCVPFYMDGDGDGFGTGAPVCACSAAGLYTTSKTGDCDDVNPNVNPGKPELCGNAVDDNCNGQIDEADAVGCTPFFADNDGDGYGVGTSVCLCAADAGHSATKSGDCNDAASGIHPGATESCNGLDDDCDGVTDPAGATGCTQVYPDGDGDGYGLTLGGICLCSVPAIGWAVQGGDCNDQSAAAHPGATEICDGIDNNCDGQIDELGTQGCVVYYLDNDGDGYGVVGSSQCQCAPSGKYTATKSGDCNDDVAAISPAATETCDGVDNNCNGATDDAGASGCTVYAADVDGDGYGASGDTQCLCAAGSVYNALKATDCNDNNAAIHPGADEICDGLDNNCDGVTDPNGSENCKNAFLDQDGDGYGTSSAAPVCACALPAGYASIAGDCNDGNAAIHPTATEVCNGLDDNCDGTIDPPGSVNCVSYYPDMDADGYGVGTGFCMCAAVGAISATAPGDCNDSNAAIHPNAPELCNGIDDNCNGQTDEGVTATYYTDADNDGYGVGTGVVQCGPSGGKTATQNGDCNDSNAAIHPNATELCNGVDDNCNGQIDEGLTGTFYLDVDQDGYGTGNPVVACSPGGLTTATVPGDCNDGNAAVHPNAAEICNSVDDNCNGLTDEGLPTASYYLDADKDGYGTGNPVISCGGSGTTTALIGGDCNDASAAIHPGATEICNGLDDNCNGQIDEGMSTATYYLDADKDGYGTTASQVACGPLGLYTAPNSSDCNDGNAAINPGHAEVCNNGLDDNCNGAVDEGCALCMANYSKDLWTLPTGWKTYNSANFSPSYYYYDGCQLVPDSGSKKGQLYYVAGRVAAAKTVITYDMAFGGGSDGMALNIINVANQTALEAYIATAGTGGCMGYGSNSAECGANPVNGIHVKMDSHDSNTGDHGYTYEYGVTFNGDPGHSPSGLYCDAYNQFSGYVDDGYYHTYVVTINGTSISATCDGESMFSGTMPTAFAGGYVGFSAGTGGSYDEFDIENFKITQTNCP